MTKKKKKLKPFMVSKIDILDKTYRIEYWEKTLGKECKKTSGDCSTRKQIIRVKLDEHKEEVIATLIHEVNHAIISGIRMQGKIVCEESFVEQFTTAVRTVRKQNKNWDYNSFI